MKVSDPFCEPTTSVLPSGLTVVEPRTIEDPPGGETDTRLVRRLLAFTKVTVELPTTASSLPWLTRTALCAPSRPTR
jgi:hypothetical protein